jgi:hypothetical protein
MAGIALAVAVIAAISPRIALRLFGTDSSEVTGAAVFGWRLFAVRIGYLGVLAWRGDRTATNAFLPIQVLDQIVFWHALATGSIRRRTAMLASTTSGAIILLDLLRRRQAADR